MTESAEEFDVIVIGAGFSGLYMLHRLRNLGLRCRVFEAGDGVGGAWYWNRYPGARCDSESYFYCYSFSDELLQEWNWSERFPAQPEIERYLNFAADRLDLRRDIRFNARVAAAVYDDAFLRWTVETQAGDKVRARYVVSAIGGLTTSNVPAIPGLDDFKGRWYHTGQWPKKGVDLSGKRVGVIGTGSTGTQAIPVIAQQAGDLTVFQRTPGYVMPARNAALDPDFVAEVKANYAEIWRKAKNSAGGMPFDPPTRTFDEVDEKEAYRLYEESWKNGGVRVVQVFKDVYSNLKSNEFAASFFRDKVRQTVKDPDVAEILAPKGYPIGAKRIVLDTNFYETFNLPNVHLVDVRKNPITKVTQTGIRAGDVDYPLDVIVFATGYDAITGSYTAIDFRGRGGIRLADRLADGPRSYLGLGFAGFPNLLTINGPCNPALGTNVPVSIEHDVEWISDCIEYLEKNAIKAIEPTLEAEEAWTDDTQARVVGSIFNQADSWQFGSNIPGKPRRFLLWLGGHFAFREKCAEVAAAGYQGFALQR